MDPDPADDPAAEVDDEAAALEAEREARAEFRRRQSGRHRRYLEVAGVAVVALLIGIVFDAGLVPLASGPHTASSPINQVVPSPPPGALSRGPDGRARVVNPRSTFTLSVSATPHGVWRATSAKCGLELCSIMQKLGPDDTWHTITALEADSSRSASYDAVAPGALVSMSPDGKNGWAGGAPASYRTHNGGFSWSSLPFDTRSMPAADVKHSLAFTVLNAGSGQAYVSPLGGDSWSKSPLPKGLRGVDRALVINGLWAFVADDGHGRELLARSTDLGRHWSTAPIPCTAPEREALATSSNTLVMLCNDDEGVSRVFRSGDAVTWTRQNIGPMPASGLATVSDHRILLTTETGLVVLSDKAPPQQADLKLVDDEVDRVSMVDSATGYLSTVHGYVYRTRDGGQSWERLPD
jgi:photosystem II stability/assembly factor-like uncharacterized protein